MALRVYRPEVIERFWSYADQNGGPEACWSWKRALFPAGYGKAWDGTTSVSAHRLAWTISNGEIPNGLHVMHSCDNPPCVNPAHLSIGTASENAQDRQRKGRGAIRAGQPLPWQTRPAFGSRQRTAKLTEDNARDIIERFRAGGITQRSLASEYGVHPSIVSEIIAGKRWPHVSREA